MAQKAIDLGATAEDLASALNISVDEAVKEFNVLRADELQEIPANTKQINEALEEVKVTARKRGGGEILEEVEVDAQPTQQTLADVTRPARDAETQLKEMAEIGHCHQLVNVERTCCIFTASSMQKHSLEIWRATDL